MALEWYENYVRNIADAEDEQLLTFAEGVLRILFDDEGEFDPEKEDDGFVEEIKILLDRCNLLPDESDLESEDDDV